MDDPVIGAETAKPPATHQVAGGASVSGATGRGVLGLGGRGALAARGGRHNRTVFRGGNASDGEGKENGRHHNG